MDEGLVLTYQDKYYKACTGKNDMEVAPVLQNGDSYSTEMYLIQFEIHSLRNLDSICLAGTVAFGNTVSPFKCRSSVFSRGQLVNLSIEPLVLEKLTEDLPMNKRPYQVCLFEIMIIKFPNIVILY